MHAVLLLGADANLEVRDADDRLVQDTDARDGDSLPVQKRAGSLSSDEALAEQRRVDDSEHGLPVRNERQRDRAQGAIPREVDRAVDRVKNPLGLGELFVATELLTQERDCRSRVGERRPDRRLDLQVDAGRKIAIALGDKRSNVSTPLPEDPRTDLDSVFGREQEFVFRWVRGLSARGPHEAIPMFLGLPASMW